MKSVLSFKEFLAESSHKKSISVEEAIKLINEHCRDTKEPLWRGMNRQGNDAYILHGEESERKSANTQNFYTVVFDKFLPVEGYPRRGNSIILANDYYTARGFGTVFAVFPYDDVPIGVCVSHDLWHSGSFQIGDSEDILPVHRWNDFWRECGLSDKSFEEFVSGIKEKMAQHKAKSEPKDDSTEEETRSDAESDFDAGKMLTDIFKTPDNVIPFLKKAYSVDTFNFKLATTKTIKSIKGDRELWISGKCVAIEKDVWDRMQKDQHDEDEASDEDED